ncbi:V-type ATPase subunit subunit G family protein [Deinococcus wulumuqiensis]|uniref:V-type ATPase subunit subunit G family protein n=1 Tax=Deinococcus wulumuqiensis TaxID=980427 RepID=UPI00034796B7
MSELASREAALDQQIEQAREEARREVAAAEQEARRIVSEAEARAGQLQAEHDRTLEAETGRIREEARAQAQAQAQDTQARAAGRVQQAAEQILRAVLP